MQNYDLVVIGCGPAGEKGAVTAAVLGKQVALVEKNPFGGGASANTGTLPSKTLRETALALSGFRKRDLYGVDLSLRRETTIRDLMHHEEQVKQNERDRVSANLKRFGVDLFQGTARFVDPHTIQMDDHELLGKKILIASGSSPVRPPEFPFEDPRVHDSDQLLRMDSLPKSLAIIGAGVIGTEYACTFATLGCEVQLVDGRDVLLPFLDREVSLALEKALEKLDIKFHKKERVASCSVSGPGPIQLNCQSGKVLEVDQVLVAAGRSSNSAELNLDAAGIVPGKRGLINVNEYYQTSVPHIYAAGDVIGFPALAATSAEQARVAICHAFGMRAKSKLSTLLPTGIYTIPEVSMVGETEESLKLKGVDYLVGRASYAGNARGQIIGDDSGFLKLLFGKADGKLLGVHVIGELASEVVHVGLVAMLTESRAGLFDRTCFNYPTLGELYKIATYDAVLASGILTDGRFAYNLK